MATISKFYLLDAATPNTGTMPTGAFVTAHSGAGTDATGARTARDATDVAGTSNPDIDATGTAAAVQTAQVLELRRFVSRPLAATTLANSNWTFSFAAGESNTNHNGVMNCDVYIWRPSTGAQVGTWRVHTANAGGSLVATAETAYSVAQSPGGTQAILDGDILVFEITDGFTQGMSVAYTSFFSYDGTTEASTTTCASFVTPPSALTLFTAAATPIPDPAQALIVT